MHLSLDVLATHIDIRHHGDVKYRVMKVHQSS